METQIRELSRQLEVAVERINQLERKVEAMRQNINPNLDGYARALDKITRKLDMRDQFSFKAGVDIARGF